jgi:2-amino-4-hydroxy-6-hydroxymethyldihydropteridine diphosphokinase
LAAEIGLSVLQNNPKTATLGIGGNIGDVVDIMRRAVSYLDACDGIDILKISPLYKTPPWGLEDQDWFINACLLISCTLPPKKLLAACQSIEKKLHRKRNIRWGPRTIDIDILTLEGFTSSDPALTVPHPRMHERAFVLVPLADIAPDLMVSGKTVSDWQKTVDCSDIERLETVLVSTPHS